MEKIEKTAVEEVRLEDISVNGKFLRGPYRQLEGIDEKVVSKMTASINRRGLIHYPVVERGTKEVLSGKRRALAYWQLGRKTILIQWSEAKGKDALMTRVEANTSVWRPDRKELYEIMKDLRDVHHVTQDEIASSLGVSKGYVSKILSWGDAGFEGTPSRKVSQGNISISAQPEEAMTELSVEPEPREPTFPSTPEPIAELLQTPDEGGERESDGSDDASVAGTGPVTAAANIAALDSFPNNWQWTLLLLREYESHVNSYIRTTAREMESNPDRRVWLEAVYEFVKEQLGHDKG